MSTILTKQVRIQGRVQGVGYRHWTATTANRLGLAGWVRNLTDGSVEVLVQGPSSAVSEFVASCQVGPSLARVTAVDVVEAPTFDGQGFEQRPTALPS